MSDEIRLKYLEIRVGSLEDQMNIFSKMLIDFHKDYIKMLNEKEFKEAMERNEESEM